MRVTRGGPLLTYCSNVHAGETLAELRSNLSRHAAAVKARVCPDRPFGVGLRLSARTAAELERPKALQDLKRFLEARGLFVFTVNGFPYGSFQGPRGKDAVFRPDWLEPERRAYTDRLARILAELLPEGVAGTISTLPGAFRPRVGGQDAARKLADNLRRGAEALEKLDRDVRLALEPGPFCHLESAADVLEFYDRWLAEPWLRRRVGVCLDACHSAVSFERPVEAFEALQRAEIPVVKVQLSAGLTLRWDSAVADAELRRLAKDAHLHQVFERRDGRVRGFLDLPEALTHARREGEWRVHWHAPLYAGKIGPFGTTAYETEALLARLRRPYPHLEVDSDSHRATPESLTKEFRWVLDRLN